MNVIDHVCGNGIRELTEDWDDNNIINEDGCNSKCKVETGYYWTRDSNSNIDKWYEICGDGIRINSSSTYWDDSNKIDDDGWSSSWVVESGWSWTGGSKTSADSCTEICGDGIRFNSNSRYWDDKNKIDGDGWSSSWAVESGWSWTGGSKTSADSCTEICGDGIRFNSNSTYWDDKNTVSGDGCSSNWTIEVGYKCFGGNKSINDKCSLIFFITSQEKSAAQSTQAAAGAGASISVGASLLSMSSPLGIFSMINQFQSLYILIVSGAYISDGVFNLITGMSIALFDFSFIKIEKI